MLTRKTRNGDVIRRTAGLLGHQDFVQSLTDTGPNPSLTDSAS